MHEDLMSNELMVTRAGRAAVIEKLFNLVRGNDSLNVVYAATSLLDIFFAHESLEIMDEDDLNLTAFVSLDIAAEQVSDLTKDMQEDLIAGLIQRFGVK